MKVLLIQPDAARELIGWGDLGAIAEPLALEYLAAGARMDGHEARLLDLRLHPEMVRHELLAFAPDVVGVTGYSMHVLRNLEICREVKSLRPDCITIAGGHHATLLAEDFFEEEIDFVVIGEGVRPFRGLLDALARGDRTVSVPAVWTRTDGRSFRYGGDAPPFDVDRIPPPDRSLVPRDRNAYYIDWMRPIALMRSTVGCPYRCSFCSLWRIMDGRYHKRGIESVVEELALIEEAFVFLVDDEAFVNKRHMLELAETIERAGIRKKFFSYCRIDTLIRHRDMLERWHAIGLDRLFIGIEAVTDEDLASYNKRLEVAQVEAGIRIAREIGIKLFAGFIVNTNFTERSFRRMTRFIEHNRIDYPSFTILTPLPGTEALRSFDAVIERQPNGRPNWSLFDLQHPVTATRLPRERFMQEYHKLHQIFAPIYTEYHDMRHLNTLRSEARRAI